ncbi:holin family protein [Cytobacillus sp. FJAT-54145]|uniref:Holin family protein n=1 Tax=Cytobacillus spartinae TaxID=3299023 RepID=A0ABW6KIU3_9BACI
MDLQIVQAYLFGDVKFLDLLALLAGLDIITGIFKAWKNKKLRSRNAYFGYARKIGIFGAVIVANVIDQILSLNGTIAFATVLFYIANEGLSIIENLAEIGIKVPSVILEKLQSISEKDDK